MIRRCECDSELYIVWNVVNGFTSNFCVGDNKVASVTKTSNKVASVVETSNNLEALNKHSVYVSTSNRNIYKNLVGLSSF